MSIEAYRSEPLTNFDVPHHKKAMEEALKKVKEMLGAILPAYYRRRAD